MKEKKKTKIERKYKHDIGKEIEFLSDNEVLLINRRRSIDSFGFSFVVLKRKSLMSVVLSWGRSYCLRRLHCVPLLSFFLFFLFSSPLYIFFH